MLHRKTRKKRAKSRQNTGILGIKTWKMENVADYDRKEGLRTRQGFGELKRVFPFTKTVLIEDN